jgi:hypothetical protein
VIRDDLSTHRCDRTNRYALHDARGIFCCYVCPGCEDARRATYRPEVLADPGYDADEPIEPDDGGFFDE